MSFFDYCLMECQPSFKTNYPYNVYFVKIPVVVNVHDCSKGKGKAVFIYKPLLLQGLPHGYFLTIIFLYKHRNFWRRLKNFTFWRIWINHTPWRAMFESVTQSIRPSIPQPFFILSHHTCLRLFMLLSSLASTRVLLIRTKVPESACWSMNYGDCLPSRIKCQENVYKRRTQTLCGQLLLSLYSKIHISISLKINIWKTEIVTSTEETNMLGCIDGSRAVVV